MSAANESAVACQTILCEHEARLAKIPPYVDAAKATANAFCAVVSTDGEITACDDARLAAEAKGASDEELAAFDRQRAALVSRLREAHAAYLRANATSSNALTQARR